MSGTWNGRDLRPATGLGGETQHIRIKYSKLHSDAFKAEIAALEAREERLQRMLPAIIRGVSGRLRWL